MSVTVIVPTFNEAPNVAPLVERIGAVLDEPGSEILFVDDSRDHTPAVIEEVAAGSPAVPVRLIHRDVPEGGLSGAVIEGLRTVTTDWAVVMDGDLQHPPEMLPVLLERGRSRGLDVVVASRYVDGGDSGGLDGFLRHFVSRSSGLLTRGMFPVRLRNVSDPMTGFFAVRVGAVDLTRLRPRGFKILLEILARQPLQVSEVPFTFGERHAGESKASLVQGMRFFAQLAVLRFGRLGPFAVIGGIGTVLNLLIMAGLLGIGWHYLESAVAAAVITILTNFMLQEHFVFADLRHEGKAFWTRFAQAVSFNGAETAVRMPFLWAIVEYTPIPPLISQAVTLGVAFLVRFAFQARVVYAPRRTDVVEPGPAEHT